MKISWPENDTGITGTDYLFGPKTLTIFMSRHDTGIRRGLERSFGAFDFIELNVDGERHTYDADAVISALENFEIEKEFCGSVDRSRWNELFGTPERAAQTLQKFELDTFNWCNGTDHCEKCPYEFDRYGCCPPDDFELLDWLRGDAE